MSASANCCVSVTIVQEELVAGCGGQRGHVEQHQAVSSAGGHEDWGILARELRPSPHHSSLIVPIGTLKKSITIATSLSRLHVCRDRIEAFGAFRVTSGAVGSG